MEKEVAGAAQDDESLSTERWESRRLSRLDRRSRRGLSLRGDTLDRGGCLLGVEILCGLPTRLGGAIGRGRTFEGTVCANEDNEP